MHHTLLGQTVKTNNPAKLRHILGQIRVFYRAVRRKVVLPSELERIILAEQYMGYSGRSATVVYMFRPLE